MDYEGHADAEAIQSVARPPCGLSLIPRLIMAAGAVFGVTPGLVASDRRDRVLCIARFAVMLIATDDYHISSTRIGLRCGGRDHSTVLNGTRRARAMMATDLVFQKQVKEIRKIIQGQIPLPPPVTIEQTEVRVRVNLKRPRPIKVVAPPPLPKPAVVARCRMEFERADIEVRAATQKLVASLKRIHPELETRAVVRMGAA